MTGADVPAAAREAIPPQAITAMTGAVASYEPEAVATLAKSPSMLLSVLLEASRRALEAAAPHLAAAERARLVREQASGEFIGQREQEAVRRAYAEGAEREREACAQLAEDFSAVYQVACTMADCPCPPGDSRHTQPFAALLRETRP